ncbi:hypothetical protein CASFOL_006372 [Castilleja foliolosa]|uniref:Cyclin-dependent protein kinase inhibitor SMR1 n=1 Tax=Castilleja foliolosa TaxID=1961234 RepID=A0ABD3EA73_9LAMI
MSTDLDFILPFIKTISSKPVRCFKQDDDDEEENCRTPKSPRHMIPAILSCPPAPRKPAMARRRSSCKRKLCDELQFFEIVARDEIQTFFTMAEKNINRSKIRRCVI